jgi:hypothetical protein
MSQNALTIISKMQLAPNARQVKYADQELGAGIAAPFAVIGYKGARWSIRHRGNTHVLQRYDGQGRPDGFPPYLNLVILLAASHHSKVYYAKDYKEGDDGIPDCWATNGIAPDQAAPNKQNPTCQGCRHNAFGSRVNKVTGSRGKACADTRRMAVVPYEDIENDICGGPMLLRVPPASLGAIGEYSDMLKANSIPYAAIATRVGFDGEEAFPKMIFEPYAALTQEEVVRVTKMQDHPLVERIVQEQIENIVAQIGSEQGENVTATDSGPTHDLTGRSRAMAGNGTPPATKTNPFAQVPGGPSYAGGARMAVQRQQEQGAAGAQPATQTAQAAPEPQQEEVLTPDQLRIRELEARLAATDAKAAKAPRRRTQPVAPQSKAEAHAGPGLPPPVGEEGGEEDGSGTGATVQPDPALSSITARLSKVLS